MNKLSLNFIIPKGKTGVTKSSIHPSSVTALSLLWGHRGFCWSRSQLSLWARAGYTLDKLINSSSHHQWQRPPCKVSTAHQEQSGVQYLAGDETSLHKIAI